MAQVTLPTYDAGYMVANRIESILIIPGASIYGQLIGVLRRNPRFFRPQQLSPVEQLYVVSAQLIIR